MDFKTFAQEHVSQITATAGLVTYAITRKKLTAGGIVAGCFVALVHMIHPWPTVFWLLILFFLLGTVVTKIGHDAKGHLTLSSTGGSGGEGARTSAQVLANTGFACLLIFAHTYSLNSSPFISSNLRISPGPYTPTLTKLLPVGIIAQYAAVTADTFSSELGILATTQPFLITAPWKQVSRGTNGGVTIDGLMYGALGSFMLTLGAIVGLYSSTPKIAMDPTTAAVITVMGMMGSLIDSLFGAVLQATVTDKSTGKVVEGPGGQRVKIAAGGSRAQTGFDLLTNNGVNFAMAATTSLLTMGVVHLLGTGVGLR
ncbi:hypothetical protein LTR37_007503 [Vermiconidia calcicola]|uniref:Uncharacterized protein n=1 Tax=Vermiconidia calcicola TaxID=1690605 RepID=A0ACC3NGH8_9PEZI|nr:hypothetical protein LTR37_007503 [Vermiconidia calcicola]